MTHKVREAIHLVEQDGWSQVDTHGSHRQYKHPVKQGRVTIPGQPGEDLAPVTWLTAYWSQGRNAPP